MCLVKKVGGDDLILVCFEVSSSSKRQEILMVSPILQSYNSSVGKKKKRKPGRPVKETHINRQILGSLIFFFSLSVHTWIVKNN